MKASSNHCHPHHHHRLLLENGSFDRHHHHPGSFSIVVIPTTITPFFFRTLSLHPLHLRDPVLTTIALLIAAIPTSTSPSLSTIVTRPSLPPYMIPILSLGFKVRIRMAMAVSTKVLSDLAVMWNFYHLGGFLDPPPLPRRSSTPTSSLLQDLHRCTSEYPYEFSIPYEFLGRWTSVGGTKEVEVRLQCLQRDHVRQVKQLREYTNEME